MNYSKILFIIKKETRALIRNKRILIGILAPLVLIPILLLGYEAISSKTEKASEAIESKIFITGDLPKEVALEIENSKSLKIVSDIDDIANSIENREIDLWLIYTPSQEGHSFTLKYDYGRSSGNRASDRISDILIAFRLEERKKLLKTVNIAYEEIEPIKLNSKDFASTEEQAGKNLSHILPLVLILYTLLSTMNFAVELTTAEKESETLETLFSIPAGRIDIVVGKLFSCILFSVLSSGVILGGLYLIAPLLVNIESFELVLTPLLMLNVFITLIPLLFIGSGLSIAIGLFASSYKESSAYITPLVFVFMIPAYAATAPGIQLNTFTAMIPILNSTLLVRAAFVNQINWMLFLAVFVINFLFALISIAFMFKVFATEKILFGSGKELSFRLNRKYINKREFIETEDVFISLAAISIGFIYANLILPRYLEMTSLFFITQYGIFVLLPVLAIFYLKGSFKASFCINKPKLSGVVSGFLLWISALSLSYIFVMIISPYVSEAPTLVGLEEQMSSWSPFFKFFFIALTPGVCEELLFRGFALQPIKNRMGNKAAIVITALVFAVIHLDFVRLVPTFLLGISFGYTTVKSRSIFPAIAFHVLNNSIAAFQPIGLEISINKLLITFFISTALFILSNRKSEIN